MKNNFLSVVGNACMYVLTVAQTKEIFQIISLVLSILISVIIIVGKIVEWYKKASADGKISKEELQEISNSIEEDVKNIEENAKEIVEVVETIEKEK